MTWESLLQEFRDLGGVAENLRLGEGRFGRGLFAIDPGKRTILHASENLLVPVDALELKDGQLTVRSDSSLGRREREFFNAYQKHFGWGSGLAEEVRQSQEQWAALPTKIADFLKSMGGIQHPDQRFLPATADVCLERFCASRRFKYGGRPHLAPLVDLTNHACTEDVFVIENGIGFNGTFADEVLIRYNEHDTWALAMNYDFAPASKIAKSLGMSVTFYGQRLSIERDDASEVMEGVQFPQHQTNGEMLLLSHLVLGDAAAMDLPRAIFRRLMSSRLGIPQADEVFDTIAYFNRQKFIELLQVLAAHDGPLIELLRDAALQQLAGLSACVGARAL